jgi:hypothetical protein
VLTAGKTTEYAIERHFRWHGERRVRGHRASDQKAGGSGPSELASRSPWAAALPGALVRLAADCRARRGELAVLRLSDLDSWVLTIERSLSAGVLGRQSRGGPGG